MGATDTLDTLQRLREVLAKAESSESTGNTGALLLRDQTLDLESEIAELSATLRHTAVSLITAQRAAADAEARLAYAQELNSRLLSLLTQPSDPLDGDGVTFASASGVLPLHAGCAPPNDKRGSRLRQLFHGTAALCVALAGRTCAACLIILALLSVAASFPLRQQELYPSLCTAPGSPGCPSADVTANQGAERSRFVVVRLLRTAAAQLRLLPAMPTSSGTLLRHYSLSGALASVASLLSGAPAAARLAAGLCMWGMAIGAVAAAFRLCGDLFARALGVRTAGAADSNVSASGAVAPHPQHWFQQMASWFGLHSGTSASSSAEQVTTRRLAMLRIALRVVAGATAAALTYGAAVALWLSLAYLASSVATAAGSDQRNSSSAQQSLLPPTVFLLHPAAACLAAIAARTVSTAAALASAQPRTLCGSESAARVLRRAVARLLGRKAATQAGLIGPAAATSSASSLQSLGPGTVDAELLAILAARRAAATSGTGSSDGRITRAAYRALRVTGPLRTILVPLARAALLLWLLHTVALPMQPVQLLTAASSPALPHCAAAVPPTDHQAASDSSGTTCDANASASASAALHAAPLGPIAAARDSSTGMTAVLCAAARVVSTLGPAASSSQATTSAWLAASWRRLLLCGAPLALLLTWLFLRRWVTRRAVAAARLRRGEAVAAVATKAAIRDAFTAAAAAAAASAAAAAAAASTAGEGPARADQAHTTAAAATAAQSVAAAVPEDGAALRAVAAIAEDRLQRAREAAATAAAAAWSVLAAVLLAALAVAVAGVVLADEGSTALCNSAASAISATGVSGTTGSTDAQPAPAMTASAFPWITMTLGFLKQLAAAAASRAGVLALLRALLTHPLPLAVAVLSDGLMAHAAAAVAASQGL